MTINVTINDVGAGVLLGGLVILLLAALALHLYVSRRICGLCDAPLTETERAWGLCTTHREQIATYWEGK